MDVYGHQQEVAPLHSMAGTIFIEVCSRLPAWHVETQVQAVDVSPASILADIWTMPWRLVSI
jgi:hypothetical protein